MKKRYAQGGKPDPSKDDGLDNITPEAQAAMEQVMADQQQEQQQRRMEETVRPPKKETKRMFDRVRGMFGVDRKKAPTKKAKGGYVRKADGVAQRGKTKGKFV